MLMTFWVAMTLLGAGTLPFPFAETVNTLRPHLMTASVTPKNLSRSDY